MRLESQANVTRQFWAIFLDSEVAKDGQVKGFQDWQREATAEAQREGARYCCFAWVKIKRDRRDPEECIATGVRALRDRLSRLPPPQEAHSNLAYAAFRFDLIQRILDENLMPIEVARLLEAAADKFPEITVEECTNLRNQNDVWGTRMTANRVVDIRSARARGERGPVISTRWKAARNSKAARTVVASPSPAAGFEAAGAILGRAIQERDF
jgi:hypothetical protein